MSLAAEWIRQSLDSAYHRIVELEKENEKLLEEQKKFLDRAIQAERALDALKKKQKDDTYKGVDLWHEMRG